MALTLDFFTLSGKFARVKTESFPSSEKALEAVKAYAESAGYTGIKFVDEDSPGEGVRFTGTTPGGRAGRNIAMGDWTPDETD